MVAIAVLLIFLDFPFASIVEILAKHFSSVSIDFIKLGKILNEGCPNASFIPEIWQGHKNNGEGFWIALEKLENLTKEQNYLLYDECDKSKTAIIVGVCFLTPRIRLR